MLKVSTQLHCYNEIPEVPQIAFSQSTYISSISQSLNEREEQITNMFGLPFYSPLHHCNWLPSRFNKACCLIIFCNQNKISNHKVHYIKILIGHFLCKYQGFNPNRPEGRKSSLKILKDLLNENRQRPGSLMNLLKLTNTIFTLIKQ